MRARKQDGFHIVLNRGGKMDALKLTVSVRKPIRGKELERVLRAIIPAENLTCIEQQDQGGVVIGKNFRIHYPEFGAHLIMTVSVGKTPKPLICANKSYKAIWVEVTKLPGIKQEDFLKDLNGPRDIVSQCQNIRDGLEKALSYIN